MNPVLVAARGKGAVNALRRAGSIGLRYGLSSRPMEGSLASFARLLAEYGVGATFPFTADALARSGDVVERYRDHDIEFAIHGLFHVDHRRLSRDDQFAHVQRAVDAFHRRGLVPRGFRSPYLRWNDDTLDALRSVGLEYDASPAIAWDVLAGQDTDRYRHVLGFYGAEHAIRFPSVPRLVDGLVQIPYGLPDDEALVERVPGLEIQTDPWVAALEMAHQRGDLFTLGLHPERFELCQASLTRTLQRVQDLHPAVWVARLDEISDWWKSRAAALVSIEDGSDDSIQVAADGPRGTTFLVRGISDVGAVPWHGTYQLVSGTRLRIRSDVRPFVGVSPATSPEAVSFLREQGYIVETITPARRWTVVVDRPTFDGRDAQPLLDLIEGGTEPLVRLGRWPDGARSALSITGDIDAMTIWDYVRRFRAQ